MHFNQVASFELAAPAADDRERGFSPSQLDAYAALIDSALQQGGVYVHCNHGRSRSPSFAMAYLMRCRGYSFKQARHAITLGVRRAGCDGVEGLAPTILEPPTSERALRFAVIERQLMAYEHLCNSQGRAAAAEANTRAAAAAAAAASDALAAAGDAEQKAKAMAQLLRAVKAGDGAAVRKLLSRDDVAAACRSLGPADVNPLHVAVLTLQVDAAAALLSFGLPFCALQRGRVDAAHSDGCGDVRRMLPHYCAAADVLNHRAEAYVRPANAHYGGSAVCTSGD